MSEQSVISGLQMWLRALKTAIQGMLALPLPTPTPPPLHSDFWGAGGKQAAKWTRKQDWPQIAEVHVKGVNSVSLEACIFP